MIGWQRVDHVQLPMPPGEEETARDFYGELLGFDEVPKPEALRGNGGCWFESGAVELHLGVEERTERSTRHPAFEVAALDAARTRLESNDVEIQEETPIPGRNRFTFRDPFGNRIELLELE